jgi:hypothetical protein
MAIFSSGRASTRPSGLLPRGQWTVDRAASTVAFEVRYLRVTRVRGRVGAFEGRLDVADEFVPPKRLLRPRRPRAMCCVRAGDGHEGVAWVEWSRNVSAQPL